MLNVWIFINIEMDGWKDRWIDVIEASLKQFD